MLLTVTKISELDLGRLMEIYTENDRNILYRYLRDDFFTQPEAAYYIWEQDGRYLSALRLEKYGDGLLLQALQTRLDQRRKGYASGLMGAVLKTLRSGTKVYSHVARSNRASLAVHSACGFTKEKDFARLLDGTVTSRYVTLSVRV